MLIRDIEDKRDPKIKENLQNKNLTNLEKQLQEIISIIKKAKECTVPEIKEILIDYCNERIEKLQPKG